MLSNERKKRNGAEYDGKRRKTLIANETAKAFPKK